MSGGLFETEDDTDIIDNTSGGLFANGEVGDAIASFEVAAEAAKDAAVAAQTAAETAETNAETAETNAATSATAAASSATSAAASATTATTQASTATTKASEAATSASTATTQAGIATTKAGEAASSTTAAASSATSAAASATTATTKASEASTSATNAASSATAASNSASTASTHKTAAETAKTAAETAKTAAETAQTAAETAKTAAETAETNAETAETNAETAETNAASSATSASTSATNAAASATSASGSASTATTQASTATTKASEASTSATNAASSATAAANSATTANTHKTAAETAKTAAETAQTAAETAKTAAETAETNAETAETNAETAETNAAASSSSASTSATNAAASATSASSSASTATTQASTATTKASEASTSATNAATSATAASNSATAAASSATSAASSATTATTQASTATTKANTATTKASEASTSAASALSAKTAAESARDSALSAFDNFDDKYLGAKSSDPTVDNDGDALVAGALYFNTTNDEMKVYTGSTWAAAYASLSGALLVSNNLSDVNSAGTAATNIGLGTSSSPTFAGATINGNISVTGTVDGRDVAADGTKLDGVEANATADQTAAEIRALVESATDSNVFTDNDHTKLNSIESNATADQTAGEIEAIVNHDNLQGFVAAEHIDWTSDQGSTNIHTGNYVNTTYSVGDGGLTQKNFTTALNTKLSNIEDNATADQSASEIEAIVNHDNLQGFVAAEHIDWTSDQGSTNIHAGNYTNTTYSVGDGGLTQNNFTNTLKSKLDGIEANATADQTDAEIRAAVEAATDSNVFTDADHTKLNGIAASANNYSHPNHSGEVTSSGDGATIIADNVVDEANLKVSNAPTDGYVLTARSGNTGGLTWETTAASVGGSAGVDFNDNVKARFGTGNDLEIYHDGSHSYVSDTGTGDLILKGSNYVKIQDAGGTTHFQAYLNNGATLYYGGNSKLNTNASGVYVTGNIALSGTVDGRDLATDGSKLDGIASSANNYVHPNHSGEVTSTADGATVIADNVVDEANLKVSNSPTNGYVLTAQSGNTGGLTWAEAASSADLYAENYDGTSTKPSATGTNTIAIGQSAVAGNADDGIAIGRGANCGTATQNIAIGAFSDCGFNSFAMALGRLAQATGGSSLALGVDSAASHDKSVAIGKSNSNGDDSFAAQIVNNTTSYGAQGNFSIAMGKLAKASGAYSTAIGESTQAQGNNSVCLGYYSQSQGQGTMVMGYDAQSTAVHCTAIGTNTRNAIDGTFKFSGGKHSAAGDAQVGIYPVLCETTDATATTFVTYHSNTITPQTDNQIVLPNNSAYAFSGTIVARQKASEGTACAAWKIEGLIRREGSAGTTVLVNSAKTVLDNTPNWDVTLSADTTNGCLKIQGTGAASTNIRWSSTITTSELTYA